MGSVRVPEGFNFKWEHSDQFRGRKKRGFKGKWQWGGGGTAGKEGGRGRQGVLEGGAGGRGVGRAGQEQNRAAEEGHAASDALFKKKKKKSFSSLLISRLFSQGGNFRFLVSSATLKIPFKIGIPLSFTSFRGVMV